MVRQRLSLSFGILSTAIASLLIIISVIWLHFEKPVATKIPDSSPSLLTARNSFRDVRHQLNLNFEKIVSIIHKNKKNTMAIFLEEINKLNSNMHKIVFLKFESFISS